MWLAVSTLGWAGCPGITASQLAGGPEGVVVMLGERHGVRRDQRRAARVIEALAERGPVTVALEAVHHEGQPSLDALRRGDLDLAALPAAVAWEQRWGYRFAAYRPVFRAPASRWVAAGLDLGPKPADREVVVPDGYAARLATALEGHGPMPPEVQARFATSMAWRDLRIAELALAGWDGRGALVIVAGRGHVEGGLGTPFQLARLTAAPGSRALLAGPCIDGDAIVRRRPSSRSP